MMATKTDKIIDIMKQPLDIYTCELQAMGYLENIESSDFAEVLKRVRCFERDLTKMLMEDVLNEKEGDK